MRTIYSNLVQSHARLIGLLAIKRGIKIKAFDSKYLLNQDAGLFERIYFQKKSRIFFSQALIRNDFSGDISQIINLPEGENSERYFLFPSEVHGIIMDDGRYEFQEDIEVTQKKWREGIGFLNQLGLSSLVNLANSADLIIGIQGEWACIQAFSNPLFPGFLALNVNAPAVIIAEQQVHEGTHNALSAKLALEHKYANLSNDSIAAFSPFTDSVRTVDRVIHGVISYTSVLNLWKAISNKPSLLKNEKDHYSDQEARHLIHTRIQAVSSRISLAIGFIEDVLSVSDFLLFKELFHEFYDDFDSLHLRNLTRSELIQAAGFSLDILDLSPIEQAELLLAQQGSKVSRISIPMSQVSTLGFALTGVVSVVPSAWVVNPVFDKNLNGFSNVSSSESHVLDSTKLSEVHLYLGQNLIVVREAAKLDAIGEAGEKLGIPKCCRNFFKKNWNDVLRSGGDLFALLVRKNAQSKLVKIPKEIDSSAMYRRGGLCWHFPCSINCEDSLAIVERRREILKKYNPKLLNQLEQAYVNKIWLLESGEYSTVGHDDAILIQFE